MSERLAILVGGGPAPGINSVIAAATIRARLRGVEVLGIRDGFERLMAGDALCAEPLDIARVSRIHFLGGSVLRTSRANPTADPAAIKAVVSTLQGLGVTMLLTIGGDDTAFSARSIAAAEGGIRVAHVPKTIDNDLDLPPDINTFGYETARHVGVGIVHSLMVDAKTTSRWYIVVTMGRKAGHLALGIGKAAGATVTVIPEEFNSDQVTLDEVANIIVGAIIKRRVLGRRDGVVVVAEGVCLAIDPQELASLGLVERDEHGNIRLSELNLGRMLQVEVVRRLSRLGHDTTVVAKNLGYELRSAVPIPIDLEYTRDLGYCGAEFLIQGGSGAMVSMQQGRFVPIPFDELMDPVTGRMKVRLVDINSTRYAIARRYMIRIRRDDFEDAQRVEDLAEAYGCDAAAFRAMFEPQVLRELAPLQLL
ncbi:MAG: diphosphate--fructose-6-phosphate 1-phosphotransferase [Phycisphaerales bacterium]|jgi:6-phosphofructokinase 1|nr:diphosphate--fructose-6-phosphate 1-phosphotransferase [Phycisphaerales bacterium]MDP6890104.1 diphosphate--fructose-6-phosphate 1-phosphotransferase [Phycisphaerales bacterium]